MDLTTTLLHGLLICIPFTAFVIISFWTWPRLWLHSIPPDIVQLTPPKTNREKAITKYILLPVYLLILPGLSVGSVIYLAKTSTTEFSFQGILVHLYGIWIFVHLWDLIIIDGGAMLLIDPNNPPIPGTEGAAGWRNFNFHFRSFVRAVLMSAVFVVPVSVILSFVL